MLKPANPDESTSMIFDHAASLASLPPDLKPTRFAHELGRGQEHRANYVAVTFGGWGNAVSALKNRIEHDLAALNVSVSAKPATKVRPNPGLTVASMTPAVDNQDDFARQVPALMSEIQRAADLQDWLLKNVVILKGWKAVVDQNRAA
jgi:hypothetical protein